MSTKINTDFGFAVKTGSRESVKNTLRAIRSRVPFKSSGALRGVVSPSTSDQLRRVPVALERFYGDRNHIDYAVYSYETPIAWHLSATPGSPDGVWVYVDYKFSPTTTHHQNAVRSALGGWGINEPELLATFVGGAL